jgi:hypothetical protein
MNAMSCSSIGRGLIALCLGAALVGAPVGATESAQDSLWSHTLVGGLNLTQVALKDWAGGGADALSWTVSLNGRSEYTAERYVWTSDYRLAFGQTKLGDQGIRKTDDKIDLSSTLTYVMGVYVNPYVAGTLKTQFAEGYNYTDAGKIGMSQLFDPAYLTQTAGVGYQPRPELKTRLGLGLREIVTRDYNGYSDDPETEDVEKVSVDAGLESVTDVQWQLVEDVLLTTKLEIFAPVAKLDETSVRSDTNLSLKVNEYISTNLNLLIVDDESAHPDVQVKEALAIGLTYTFM